MLVVTPLHRGYRNAPTGTLRRANLHRVLHVALVITVEAYPPFLRRLLREKRHPHVIVFFQSERLWFRPPQEEDVERVAGWVNNPRVRKHLASRVFPISLHAEKEWINNANPLVQPGTGTRSVLVFGQLGDERPIGATGLEGVNWVVRSAEWGILIGEPDCWNQGYGREVARRILKYAFEELNLNRVELKVNVGNCGGVCAYEAVGFRTEGTLRQAAFVDGAYQDSFLMSVLREDWRAVQA